MRHVIQAVTLGILGAALLSIGACGGAAVPTAARTDATAAIRSAREVGAEGQPQASYYLELANEQIDRAGELIRRGDNQRAELLLRRAEADADLAIALTRTAATEAEAAESMERIQEMRERYL
jgi:hypothetical protein